MTVRPTTCALTVITCDNSVGLGWPGTTRRKCVTGNTTCTVDTNVRAVCSRTPVSIAHRAL